MRALFVMLIPILLWIVVLWRAPSVRGTPASRALWATSAAVAVALSMRPAFVARRLESLTGVIDVTQLIKHLAALTATCFMVNFVYAIHGRPGGRVGHPRLRYAVTTVAAVVMTVLFVFFLPHDHRGSTGIDAHYGDPAVQLYLAVFYLFLATSTAVSARLFWSNRRNVPAGLLRTGIRFLAAGTATGFAYALYRVGYVAVMGDATEMDEAGKPVPLFDPVSELLPALAMILIVLGLSIPPTRTVLRYFRDQHAMWKLYPLWSDLVDTVPHVVFGTPVGRVRDLFTLGDRTLDVAHRAFEIRDATLALRDDAPFASNETTLAGPTDRQPGDDRQRAQVEAIWLHAVARAKSEGTPVPKMPPALSRTAGGGTPREEIAWLLRVADHYRRIDDAGSPVPAGADPHAV
ncbi:MAB_1171c family putative transporter [Embleya scabrispora]|uniref:MAB_1171c family putative transporter n=1 Tax=Embleya scabrispora TaxID=159449 RepID=UPI00036292ED|nr:MAB_1171c family putative transporter [Embleya scabrispora]MYS80815.1 hypothetical protein [Streptomyces sp. SID5474]